MIPTLNKARDGVKRVRDNMISPTPPKDRVRRNGSLIVGISGFVLKILAAYFPEYVPDSLQVFFDHIFWAGVAGLGAGAYFQSKKAK